MRRFRLALLSAALCGPAFAQAPITLIVNFVAGGPSDLMARLLAPELSARLGAPIAIRNAAGAAGGIGAAEAARARPDETTLLLSPIGAMVIQPSFRTDLPYRPTDLTPICQVADTPVVIMSALGGPRSLAEVAARAREAGGGFHYASTGPGYMAHVATAALAGSLGVAMTHVPFHGNAEAVVSLLRGDVAIFADQPGYTAGQQPTSGCGVRSRPLARISRHAHTAGVGAQSRLFDLVWPVCARWHTGGVHCPGRCCLRLFVAGTCCGGRLPTSRHAHHLSRRDRVGRLQPGWAGEVPWRDAGRRHPAGRLKAGCCEQGSVKMASSDEALTPIACDVDASCQSA